MSSITRVSRKDTAAQSYRSARTAFLMIVIVSAVNVGLLFLDSDTFYLISAIIPYVAVILYQGAMGLLIAFAYLAACLLCWFLSKKRPGWMIAGCALYAVDLIPAVIVYMNTQEFLFLWAAFLHLFMLLSITAGIVGCYRKVNVPEDYADAPEEAPVRGAALRRADQDVKFRILLEAEYAGHKVVYRRVKRVNELVIDGYVYDEMEMLVEPAHTLSARIDGQIFEVGYDGRSYSYFRVDGMEQAKKIRWY